MTKAIRIILIQKDRKFLLKIAKRKINIMLQVDNKLTWKHITHLKQSLIKRKNLNPNP
jgi:hypothetical protein